MGMTTYARFNNTKSRLLEQINDLKSCEKTHELELHSMDDTIQRNINIQTIDQTIINIQKRTINEKTSF
jgi:glutathionylspermidine synthase